MASEGRPHPTIYSLLSSDEDDVLAIGKQGQDRDKFDAEGKRKLIYEDIKVKVIILQPVNPSPR